jgi:hypothetical protein
MNTVNVLEEELLKVGIKNKIGLKMEKLSFSVWINNRFIKSSKIKSNMLFKDILIMVQYLVGITIFLFITNVINMQVVIQLIMVISMIKNNQILMN